MYSPDPPEMFARKYCQPRHVSSWGLGIKRRLKAVPPVLAMFRPQVGQCCHQCTPKSRDVKLLQRSPSLGFQNLIHISEKNTRYRGWLVRRLCCVLLVGSRKVYCNTPGDRGDRLCKSTGVKKVLSSTDPLSDEENQQGLTLNTRELTTHIHPLISTCISPLLLRIASWVLLKLFRGLFYSVQVNLNHVAALHRVTALGHPLVFVSQQQRGLDYMLIALVLFCHNLQVPYTVCHLRPGSTWIRLILQRLGVIFPPPQAERDVDDSGLHEAIMTSFIGELLREGRSVSFGLAVSSGQGARWLARIREVVRDGAVPDVSLVPVSVAYDRAPQLHMQAQQGVLSLLCSLLSLLCEGAQGSVRIHFAHPFSLKEMCDTGKYHVAGARPLQEVLIPVILDNRLDHLFRQKTMSWMLHPSFCPDLPPSERQLTIYLTQHLLYSTASCTAVMSTGLVSCLLLHKHPKGLHLSRLSQDLYWLLREVLFRKRDVGFGGSLSVVLYHALSVLQPHLVLVSPSDVMDPFLAPRSSPADVLALAGHCQSLTHVFIKEAVGACTVSSMLREVACCGGKGEVEFGVAFCQGKLTETALKLSHLLPAGYIPPCTSAHSFALDAVDSLVHCGILVKEELLQDHCVYDFWRRRKDLLWRSSDDMDYSDSDCEEQELCCYKLSQPSQCTDLLFFLCSLLSVYLRALSWAIEWLDLLRSPLPEPDSQALLRSFLQDRVIQGRRHYESSSADMAEAAVRTFIDLGVLEKVESGDGGVPVLGLSPLFQQQESREKLGSFVQQFLHT
ncbi:glycerol-3-phosphate acyltransferase 2, mitochondrial isoform X1 [Scleropages formosus]|uniref:Glycerol-3-phosphate acyltransferase 2, mitochondrial n=1 Tax=Scleropages formosus TaxID=113540 RepID=A0A8C9S2F1_SCLFO|nr:glycerol-3-phosphate acyltransferase 2, mitochondrial-like isoform X1 [Scleropages formosus]XP_029112690.1 glycerol-3-phosphate acyltransferase 2, mitochondrial-like isoform X1 [Scleropages formosus]XP_029112691.1 glycerol-3-phosphate acyltransferase 2, mitochondrial-like isoform X1 [Scleropages formosus]XP_029112693.1 glycerol-3-phosphate acyltransferase 2, mitochondrial-like isoform X1 [Scleropages formosus]